MSHSKTVLGIAFVTIVLLISGVVYFLSLSYDQKENFQPSSVKENVSKLFDLKDKKKQFLNSITKLNKEISSLKEYYSNIEKIDETD